MAFTTITKPSVGDATKKTAFADAVIDNLNDLNSRVGSGSSSGVPNGSFEAGDPDPDSWTTTNLSGGSHTIENDTNSEQAHGADALNFTYGADANGGGYTETTDFAECAAGEYLKIAWKMMSSGATGAKHIVSFYWYKFDQSASGVTTKTDAYSDTGNPDSWTQFYTEAVAPSDTKYYKIRITISDTSVTPSLGNTSIDDVRMVKGPSEVFNNVAEFNAAQTSSFRNVTAQCLWVEAIGGGGGGGTANIGGGGGGEYAAGHFFAAATTAYAVLVGAGGASGADGADTTFNSTTVVAVKGAKSASTAGGTGGTGGTGTITIDGQVGHTNSEGAHGGAGARGGGGAQGGASGSGKLASAPGGGGGGDTAASAGAAGMVRIWYN